MSVVHLNWYRKELIVIFSCPVVHSVLEYVFFIISCLSKHKFKVSPRLLSLIGALAFLTYSVFRIIQMAPLEGVKFHNVTYNLQVV